MKTKSDLSKRIDELLGVVMSAAQRECHYAGATPVANSDCRSRWKDKVYWPRWCAACVCKNALPEIWIGHVE